MAGSCFQGINFKFEIYGAAWYVFGYSIDSWAGVGLDVSRIRTARVSFTAIRRGGGNLFVGFGVPERALRAVNPAANISNAD